MPGKKNSQENAKPPPASIPTSAISKILGLLELLRSKGGRADIYKLAAELSMELGETLTVIRGAELLGLVHTPGGDVVLQPLGDKVTRARIPGKKAIIRERLEQLPVFQKVRGFLLDREDHEAARGEVLEVLAGLLPNENARDAFDSVVHLGRYAELFGYNDDTETFYPDDDANGGARTAAG